MIGAIPDFWQWCLCLGHPWLGIEQNEQTKSSPENWNILYRIPKQQAEASIYKLHKLILKLWQNPRPTDLQVDVECSAVTRDRVFNSADGQPLYQLLGIISLYRKKKSGPKLLFHGPKWLSKDVTLGGGFIF